MSAIWYISKYTAPPPFARVSSRGFQLLREFSSLGHTCLLITSSSNHLASPPKFDSKFLRQYIDGIEVYWLRDFGYTSPRSFARIISWLFFEFSILRLPLDRMPAPSVVIVSSLSLTSLLSGIFLKYRFQVPLIFEVRDIWPLFLIKSAGYSAANPLVFFLAILEKIGYSVSDLIVGLMPNLESHVRKVTPRSKVPVICIPHGFDHSFHPGHASLSAANYFLQRYIPHDTFTVCYAGTIGFDNALDVFFQSALLLRENKAITFVVIGEGYMLSDYLLMANAMPNVVFIPRLDKPMLGAVLSRMNVLFFSTFKSEVLEYGQSLNKLIDYMLAGRPIIGAYSGFPSMVNEACCGTFVESEDPVALSAEIVRFSQMTVSELDFMGFRAREWVVAHRSFKDLACQYLSHMRTIGVVL